MRAAHSAAQRRLNALVKALKMHRVPGFGCFTRAPVDIRHGRPFLRLRLRRLTRGNDQKRQ
jgi:hypothetical protein